MKPRLLFATILLIVLNVNSQTTHNLNWFTGIGSSVDLTIDVGDTIIWTWTDALPHTVQNVSGSSVETFNSGTLTGNGQTFSYTFTTVGSNDYFCGIHGAASMSGTITVQSTNTTHNLDWFTGIGSNVDLTIESGDTVTWTWTDTLPHTVQNVSGSSVETFNSGTLTGNGQTFSYTFTTVGSNDYFCGIHGAASMSGTITVTDNLSLEGFEKKNSVKLFPNPTNNELHIEILNSLTNTRVSIIDITGKTLINTRLNSNSNKIDVSSLKSGLYLIKLDSDTGSQTKRFVKK